ncbi:hypothetical protein [Chromobacterium phragmitis]|uniref:Uncharacterized protein n=1 Tax=Chromobacterium phragmitis TaxID=2202141 RepID=A0ABV0J0W5_9NEIS
MKAKRFDPNKIHESASFRHLHYRNLKIGRNKSRLNSLALGALTPLMSGELLAKQLLRTVFSPLGGLKGVFGWAVGVVVLVLFSLFGMVHLQEGEKAGA